MDLHFHISKEKMQKKGLYVAYIASTLEMNCCSSLSKPKFELPVMHLISRRYLLPEHVDSCHLRISYSSHTDLNIKFQSHRSSNSSRSSTISEGASWISRERN